MVENFAGLIDRYGHIPNGSRSYYLSRSQPPFFAAMVRAARRTRGRERADPAPAATRARICASGWKAPKDLLPAAAHRRVVRLADGSLLNRYWDDLAIPRDEAYLEDVETAQQRTRPARGRGISRPARSGGKRLGLQLAMARGWQDAELDSHDRHPAGGSQQPAVQAGDRHRARLQGGASDADCNRKMLSSAQRAARRPWCA